MRHSPSALRTIRFNVRAKLEHAQEVDPDEFAAPRRQSASGARFQPDVDLYVAPVLGVDVPPVDCDELDIRIPATAFLRPFNVLGWAAIAIRDLQLVAPRDEVVLAAALRGSARTLFGVMSLIFPVCGSFVLDLGPRTRCSPCRGHGVPLGVSQRRSPGEAGPPVQPERRVKSVAG